MIFRCVKKGWINWCVDLKCVFFYKLRYLNFFINWEFVATTGPQLCEIWITLQIRPSVDLQETTCHQNWPTHSHWRAHSSDNIHSTVRLPTPTKSHQPITQAFSSCLHDLARNFVTSPNGISYRSHSVTSQHFAPSQVEWMGGECLGTRLNSHYWTDSH